MNLGSLSAYKCTLTTSLESYCNNFSPPKYLNQQLDCNYHPFIHSIARRTSHTCHTPSCQEKKEMKNVNCSNKHHFISYINFLSLSYTAWGRIVDTSILATLKSKVELEREVTEPLNLWYSTAFSISRLCCNVDRCLLGFSRTLYLSYPWTCCSKLNVWEMNAAVDGVDVNVSLLL